MPWCSPTVHDSWGVSSGSYPDLPAPGQFHRIDHILWRARSSQPRGTIAGSTLLDIPGDIGFGIGPRLNALGRLSDANPVVEFLTTDDPSRARVMAIRLEGLNERRKLLTEQITQAALAQIEQDRSLLDHAALVLAYTDWHTGVIGIVASRLVEIFGRPTILLSIGEDGFSLARSSILRKPAAGLTFSVSN